MRIKGQEQIAAVFGITAKTVNEWQQEGFPVMVRGGPGVPSEYDSEACIQWLVDREVRKVQGESPTDRLHRVRADAIELANALKRREVAPIGVVSQVIALVGRQAAQRLDAIKPGMRLRAPELPADVLDFVEGQVAAARNLLASMTLDDVLASDDGD